MSAFPAGQTDPAQISSDADALIANHLCDCLVDVDADNQITPRLATDGRAGGEDGLTNESTLAESVTVSTASRIRPPVMGRVRNSLRLALITLFISVPLAVVLGVIAGLNEDTFFDNLMSITSLSVVGLPGFATGLILIQIFAFGLKLLPASWSVPPAASFIEALPKPILPALTATLVLLAYVARLKRAGFIEELERSCVRTATLKGPPCWTVFFTHVLHNALLPTITVVAISFRWLIGGLVVVENICNYPGLGRLLVFAGARNDLPMIQAVTIVTVAGSAWANLGADLLYAVFNPRIRLGE